jgi:nucleoside-diphosphate-sugar epimerase
MVQGLRDDGWDVTMVELADPYLMDCRQWFLYDWTQPIFFDLVVHCAALVDGREMIDGSPARIAAYNLSLDAAMFEWALRARPKRVLYFSSSAAYPTVLQNHGNRLTLLESDHSADHTEPDQTYGWVKWIGEQLVRQVRAAGVPVTVVRPFSGYGSDQDDKYPFPAMIDRALRYEDPFTVWGDGKQVRDFIHVDDIVKACLRLVQNEVDGPVNLGTGVGTPMHKLAALCMGTAGYLAEFKFLSDKPSGVQYRVADTTLMSRYYTPKVELIQGIRRAMRERQI